MNKKIKNLSQEIRSGKQLQENIPQLLNYMADYYQTYAEVRLVLHYYAFYEAYLDEEDTWSKEAKAAVTQLNHMVKNHLISPCSGAVREKAIREADDLRKEISKRMNMLTVYTDIFQIYEYVINRLEYRFKEKSEPVDEIEFEKEILRYIFADEDNFIINEKIREIIGQLPIRITKQKYFDLLLDSLNAYLGSDEENLKSYLYIIRTSAMLYREEGMEDYYPELAKRMQQLAAVDFKNMTKQTFDQCVGTLRVATLMLETEITVYFGLQEMINEVYTMLLCTTYAGMVENEHGAAADSAMTILGEINESFLGTEKAELSDEFLDRFTDMEGVQEDLSYELTVLEDAFYEINHTHKDLARSMMLDQLLQVLERSEKLLSNSLFIDLEEDRKEEIVDEELLEKESNTLITEISAMFENQDKIVSRAIIANTLNKMPVFFKDHTEVMDYVRYSIERCSDASEKVACIEIINAIMSE